MPVNEFDPRWRTLLDQLGPRQADPDSASFLASLKVPRSPRDNLSFVTLPLEPPAGDRPQFNPQQLRQMVTQLLGNILDR